MESNSSGSGSSNGYYGPALATREEPPPEQEPPSPGPRIVVERAVKKVMAIESRTFDVEGAAMRFRGRLMVPSEEAFNTLRPEFETVGATPKMRMEGDQAAIYVLPVVYEKEDRGIAWGPIILLIVTLLSVFFVGAAGELYVGLIPAIANQLGMPVPGVDPALLPTTPEFWAAIGMGVAYTAALMGILGAHEMGHYLMARRYNVDTTPPFFIPLPFIGILGTLGAVIAMREPAPNRKIQFDIGVAGPLAGLIVTVPVLIIGLLLSEVQTRAEVIAQFPPELLNSPQFQQFGGIPFLQEGNSIAYLAAKYAVFGQILPQGTLDVFIHPVAFAGWAGLLVTALNLMPVGQLDGGHVMYGLLGDKAQKLRIPVIAALAIMAAVGSLQGLATTPELLATLPQALQTAAINFAELPLPGWGGWWLWVALLFFLVRNHAPVLDEITELDQPRKTLGVAMIVIFVLIFTPRPLVVTTVPLGTVTAMVGLMAYTLLRSRR